MTIVSRRRNNIFHQMKFLKGVEDVVNTYIDFLLTLLDTLTVIIHILNLLNVY